MFFLSRSASETRRRPHIRFGLSAIFVLLTVFACCFGWVKWRIGVGHRQRRALEQLRGYGNVGVYDRSPQSENNQWLRKLLGEDYFFAVQDLRLSNVSSTHDMNALAELRNLEKLSLAFGIEEETPGKARMKAHDLVVRYFA